MTAGLPIRPASAACRISTTVCSDADQRTHQGSASLAFVRQIHRWPVNYRNKGLVMRKIIPFHDVIIICYEKLVPRQNLRLEKPYDRKKKIYICWLFSSFTCGLINTSLFSNLIFVQTFKKACWFQIKCDRKWSLLCNYRYFIDTIH